MAISMPDWNTTANASVGLQSMVYRSPKAIATTRAPGTQPRHAGAQISSLYIKTQRFQQWTTPQLQTISLWAVTQREPMVGL
jgi:hypothetical protein